MRYNKKDEMKLEMQQLDFILQLLSLIRVLAVEP